jgi:hypothetical protein
MQVTSFMQSIRENVHYFPLAGSASAVQLFQVGVEKAE